MMRRVALWVFCVVLLGILGCGSSKPQGGSCKSGYTSTYFEFDGHRYLYIRYPDGRSAVVSVDEPPAPDSDAIGNYFCPCELDECIRMCLRALEAISHTKPICHTPRPPTPPPDAPTKK